MDSTGALRELWSTKYKPETSSCKKDGDAQTHTSELGMDNQKFVWKIVVVGRCWSIEVVARGDAWSDRPINRLYLIYSARVTYEL